MSRDIIDALLRQLGMDIELADLELDEDGYCCLTFDDIEAHFQYDSEQDELVLFSNIGSANLDDDADLYRILLAANLFWAGTNGATLSLQPETNSVYLMTRTPSTAFDDARFQTWINNFVNTAETWRDKLQSLQAATADIPTSDDDENPDNLFAPNMQRV